VRRRFIVKLVVALAGLAPVVVGAAGPASAIETASFGLGPAGPATRTALHPEIKPGSRVDDAVRLWNKTDMPVVVRLQVQGAALDAGGQVSLGGNGGAAQWISLGQDRVELAPRASVEVPVVLRAPRNMPDGETTAAIVAEVEPAGGSSNVAVVQRVALMVYASAPEGSSLRASLGWVLWFAVALLLGVAVYAVTMRRAAA
jgi:hypothetical protein